MGEYAHDPQIWPYLLTVGLCIGVTAFSWHRHAISGARPLAATSGCKATITGKNTIQAVDRLTSVPYSIGGNYQFQVDVTDNQEPGASPGAGPDQYAIRVWSTSGTYYELGDTYDDNGMLLGPLDIMGGNIQVKARK